jgi:hypothetical protein
MHGRLKLGPVLLLVALVAGIGVALSYLPSKGSAVPIGQGAPASGPHEVDFGFVELNPGQPTPITSYKNGGTMVLYAGESLRFQLVGGATSPSIELRAGDGVQSLAGTAGEVPIAGPPGRPLPALMVAQGERVSLPGGAPPRISIKVQVYGGDRPKL